MTTGVACPNPILQFFNNSGQPNVGGTILTQVGGVNAATYQDSGLTTALPNPIPLNSRGEVSNASGTSCQLFLTPNVVYTFTMFDAKGNQLNQASYVDGVQVTVTATSVGQALYPQTSAELAASVTPTNYAYQAGDLRRYGGVGDNATDNTTAINSAIAVAVAGAAAVIVPREHSCTAGSLQSPVICRSSDLIRRPAFSKSTRQVGRINQAPPRRSTQVRSISMPLA